MRDKQIKDKSTPRKHAIAYVTASLNNTIITITDLKGNAKTWSSAGTLGFKGARRSSNYAAQATADHIARKAVSLGIKSVEVKIQGISFTKESALRGFKLGGLHVIRIKDQPCIPHNGCRPSKKRRI